MTQKDSSNGRKPLVIAEGPRDIMLKIYITVDDYDEATVTLEPEAKVDALSKHNLGLIFEDADVDLVNGTYVIQVTVRGDVAGLKVIELPECMDLEAFQTESVPLIFGGDSRLGKLVSEWFDGLYQAHRKFPRDMEALAGAVVQAAIMTGMHDNDPLRQHLELPTAAQMEAMQVQSGCATHAFIERDLEAILRGYKPKLRKGVLNVGGTRVMVMSSEGELMAIIGYLECEDLFADLFHDELVARLALVIPTAVRQTLESMLIAIETRRRLESRMASTMLDSYGFDADVITSLADQQETKTLERMEELRRQESEYDGRVSKFIDMLGDLLQNMDMEEGPDAELGHPG